MLTTRENKRPANKNIKKDTNINESYNISAFIAAISSKKYAQAHKYLKLVVNEKIKNRISKAAAKPLF